MLFPAIKLGPREWRERLDESSAKYAEIYYRADKPEWYPEMLKGLGQRGVSFGLHFWAATSGSYEANLAFPGERRKESTAFIERTLDVAAETGAFYVNIHTGNRRLCRIDFDRKLLAVDETAGTVGEAESAALRNEAVTGLAKKASSLGVLLLVEAIPAREQTGPWGAPDSRLRAQNGYATGLDGLFEIMETTGLGFTNDFCHVFAMGFDRPREELLADFWKVTQRFAGHTRVAHISTLTTPYNGTDAHYGILPEDLGRKDVFPTRDELFELLRVLSRQEHDVWLVGEPAKVHVENYKALIELVRIAA